MNNEIKGGEKVNRKKVKYSLIKFTKKGSQRFTGLAEIDDENLYINGRTYEDCIRYCNKVINTTNEYKGNFTQIEEIQFENDKNQIVELEVETSYSLWFKIL